MSGARAVHLAVVLASLMAGAARAEPPARSLALVTVGGCPDEPQLRAALSRALPAGVVLADAAAKASETVRVEDLGPRYRVGVGDRSREYDAAQVGERDVAGVGRPRPRRSTASGSWGPTVATFS